MKRSRMKRRRRTDRNDEHCWEGRGNVNQNAEEQMTTILMQLQACVAKQTDGRLLTGAALQ